MTVEKCKKCPYHVSMVEGQVMCKYGSNIDSMATEDGNVIGCPLDKKRK